MSKRTAIVLAILVGLVAISTPIAISIYWAWKQSLDEQLAHVALVARDSIRRSDIMADQVHVIYRELKVSGASDPCSDENIRLMRKLDLKTELFRAVAYIKNDTLLCSSYGRHNTPVGPVNYTTPFGSDVRRSIEFPILPGTKYLLLSDRTTGYSVIVHPNFLDVFANEPDLSIGMFSLVGNQLSYGRGIFKPEWMNRLGETQEARFSDGENLVVIRRSRMYANAAFASVPVASVNEKLRRTALVLVPIGLAAGVALALAVFYLARQQLALPAVLKVALKRNEFFLNYQPIVDLRTGKWVGAEALIRWRRPNGEMVRPDIFIAVAEETGLIQQVTQRVMTIIGSEARELFSSYPEFHIAINLSAADLESRSTLEGLRRLAGETGARSGNLLAEATERGFMRTEVAKTNLHDIRAMGIQTAIDDFGTGYSSLSYLEAFELDYLKIDKSFVDTLGKETATSQVVPHIIEMAKSLKLQMIAEGVETEAQAQFLRERGVQFAQGWLFAKAMPFSQLVAGLSAANKNIAR